MKGFGERLRELRLDKKLSTINLGKEIGVSDSTINRWENEKMYPTIDKLYLLAKYFGVTSDYLLGLED